MHRTLLSAVTLAALSLASSHVYAQRRSVGFTVGYTNEPLQTLAVSALYAHPVSFFRLLGAMDFVIPEGDGRYYRDTFSNGQSRCRDSETGRFASDTQCGAGLAFGAVRGELLLPIPRIPLEVGVGVRIGDRTLPYAAAGFETKIEEGKPILLYAHGAGGEQFIQADAGISVRF
jgi:opacity protein-like surface antigen